MKHVTEEQLVAYCYGEPCDENHIRSHLGSCSACRTKFEELKKLTVQLDRSAYAQPELELDVARAFREVGQETSSENSKTVIPSSAPPARPWSNLVALAAMGLIAIAGFLAGDFYRTSQLEAHIDSTVIQHMRSELTKLKSVNEQRLQALEHLLQEHNVRASDDAQLHNQVVVAFEKLAEEQSRIDRELEALATNTDNAFQLTRATTKRNTRALIQLRDATGWEFFEP